MDMVSREMDPNRGRSGRSMLGLEALESRWCPSTAVLQGHALVLTGDASDSIMMVRDAGQGNVTATVVDGHGHKTTVTGKNVQEIEIRSTTGNDRIDYQLTGPLAKSEKIDLALGSGYDQVNLNFSPGVSAPSLAINLNGGKGSDDVNASFGAIRNTDLTFNATVGAGVDHFQAGLNGNLTGTANVLLKVTGGHSYDGIKIGAHGNIAASARLAIDAEGAPGTDTIHVDYTGQLAGRLSVLAKGNQQFDWIESNINLAAGSKGSLDAKVQGGRGDDLLILRVKGATKQLHSLSALLDGGAGYNIGVHTANVKVVNIQE
jgi:hypothetical protein